MTAVKVKATYSRVDPSLADGMLVRRHNMRDGSVRLARLIQVPKTVSQRPDSLALVYLDGCGGWDALEGHFVLEPLARGETVTLEVL